jgi:hypothetical protein
MPPERIQATGQLETDREDGILETADLQEQEEAMAAGREETADLQELEEVMAAGQEEMEEPPGKEEAGMADHQEEGRTSMRRLASPLAMPPS